MPGPIDTKYNSTQSDDVGSDSDVGGDYDPGWGEDPYADVDAATEGDIGDIQGDEFITEGDGFGGGSGVPPAPSDPTSFHAWLRELKANGDITETQFDHYSSQVELTFGLSAAGQQSALSRLGNDIHAQFATEIAESQAVQEAEQEEDIGLKSDLEDFIQRVEDNDNLSSSAKREFVSEAERLLADYELVKDEPDAQYRIEEELSELQERYTEFLTMPESAQSLADKYTDGDVGKIMEAAEKHNLDLNELPEPPTTDVFEFLAELDPAIGPALEAAQDKIREKKITDGEMNRRATEDSAENSRSTTGSGYDGVDMEAFRYLSSARYFEDSGSAAVAAAFAEVTGKLVDGLKGLYPDANISTVGTGFKEADLIKFDGETIDVLSNKEGAFIAGNEGADTDLDIPEMVTLEYDWEGDGDWEDKSSLKNFLNEMKDVGYPTHCYD